MDIKNFGYIPSTLDGTERVFGVSNATNELPDSYTYRPYLPEVLNQGSLSICVPCSVSAFLNWRENLKDGDRKDNKISLMDIYNARTNDGDGMTFKAAFKYLRHNGVSSKNGLLRINSYGMVKSIVALKFALVMNGPCVGALPVFSEDDDFWNNFENEDWHQFFRSEGAGKSRKKSSARKEKPARKEKVNGRKAARTKPSKKSRR